MVGITYNPNILVVDGAAAQVQMASQAGYVEMAHKGRGIKPHAHGRKRRRRMSRR